MTRPIALVTGANRGLGRATAVALAATHRVVLAHRGDPPAAQDALRAVENAGGEAVAIRLDVSDVPAFPAFRDALCATIAARWRADRLDVLVNNAGVGRFEPFEEVTPENFDALVGTNFRGTFFLIQALAPLLERGGRIVNVSTSLTRHVSPGSAVYAASKTAVESLTRALAPELGARGIRINTIAPGPTATDFNGGAMRDDPALRQHIASSSSLDRVGEPEDIAGAIAGLVSESMGWITGERIEVSGGSFL